MPIGISARVKALFALFAALGCVVGLVAAGPGAAGAAGTVTYTNTQTIPVPPASSYAGSGGGDGWSLAFSATQVYNVFHHQGTLQVECHKQSDASLCDPAFPITVTDAAAHNFGTSGHPGLFYDNSTKHLFIYATRDDSTSGVVCFDTAHATTAPFCGFTALTASGHSVYDPPNGGGSNLSEPVAIGTKFYAFNYVNGVGATTDQNAMLCFNVSTVAACAGQPYAVPFAAGNSDVQSFPEPSVADIGGKIIVANSTNDGTNEHVQLSCFDPSTTHVCTGTWPVAAPSGYTAGQSGQGAPFALPAANGSLRGFCLPTGNDECFTLSGASLAPPSGLVSSVEESSPWNGTGVVIGPRVYVPNGRTDQVDCYDASSDTTCPGFPKTLDNLELAYTATLDPQRPTCIWINADGGSAQIQNFDAFTGGACGQGPIRVLASSFVVNQPQCTPGAYSTLKVDAPARNTYSTGDVQFLDGDAQPLPGASNRSLDNTGTADLTGLNLNSPNGLPQFLITLNGIGANPGAVTVTLVWRGTQDPSCVKPGTTVSGSNSHPTITAHVSSKAPKNKAGWYRTPVKVSFTCTTDGSPLTSPCPSPVTLSHDGRNQSVSRTITAQDGGTDTATVSGINIDRTPPTVRITGVATTEVYPHAGPAGHCEATDALSGVASCTLTRRIHGSFETYTATAFDKAGNKSVSTLGAHVADVVISAATFSNGAYVVHQGGVYTLVAVVGSQPRYINAVPYHAQPTVNGPFFHHVSGNHWALGFTITENRHSHVYWNIGVKVGSNLYVLTIRVIA